jgi:hypothetical protein
MQNSILNSRSCRHQWVEAGDRQGFELQFGHFHHLNLLSVSICNMWLFILDKWIWVGKKKEQGEHTQDRCPFCANNRLERDFSLLDYRAKMLSSTLYLLTSYYCAGQKEQDGGEFHFEL